jgi:DNA-directed RNA polymerase specialized sigma24 family protein
MEENNPPNLRARLTYYRQMLRDLDDPALRDALGVLIRLTQEKLKGFAISPPVTNPPIILQDGAPATLGDVLYANRKAPVLEQDWATLVRSIAAGDQVALHALYERAHLIVFTFALRISGDRRTAEQLTIDVFHDLWRRAFLYDPADGTVVAWIMNETRSLAMAYWRSAQIDQASWHLGVLRPSASLQAVLARRIAEETGTKAALPTAPQWFEPKWERVGPGIECKLLATDTERHRVSMLVRLAPGASYPAHVHAGTEELFLLDGELLIDERKLFPGDYYFAGVGTGDDRVWSETGCTCVLVTSISDRLC